MSDYNDALVSLVSIYASSPLLASAREDARLIEIYNRYKDDLSFVHFWTMLESKINDLSRADSCMSNGEQVKECLKSIYRLAQGTESRMLGYCDIFIRQRYGYRWTQQQLKYYTEAKDRLLTYWDYFLSFTRKSAVPKGFNVINQQYKHFIREALAGERLSDDDFREENLLARALHRVLTRSRYLHKGYYWPEQVPEDLDLPIDQVREMFLEACRHSHAFIQLIQNITLTDPPTKVNYCLIEYEEATKMHDIYGFQRIKFVMAGQNSHLINDHLVRLEYGKWYNHIKSQDVLIMLPTKRKADAQSLIQMIEDKLSSQVEQCKISLFEDVPL